MPAVPLFTSERQPFPDGSVLFRLESRLVESEYAPPPTGFTPARVQAAAGLACSPARTLAKGPVTSSYLRGFLPQTTYTVNPVCDPVALLTSTPHPDEVG